MPSKTIFARTTALAALLSLQPALFTLAGVAAANDQTFVAAEVCLAPVNSDTMRPDFLGGIYNSSTTAASGVACGVGQDQTLDTNDVVRVYVSDRNGDPGQNISCYGFYSNASYTDLVYTEEVYACTNAGGCPTNPGRFAAETYLQIGGMRHGGGYTTILTCGIPPKIGSDVSTIGTLFLDER